MAWAGGSPVNPRDDLVLAVSRPPRAKKWLLALAGVAFATTGPSAIVAFGINGVIAFLTALSFAMLGFILGIWAGNFEQLQLVPLLVITPLVFLGGSFYSISMLPPIWQTVTLFNPVVYLISGFRWSFFEVADVSVGLSLSMVLAFLATCLLIVWWMFKTGYRLKQ